MNVYTNEYLYLLKLFILAVEAVLANRCLQLHVHTPAHVQIDLGEWKTTQADTFCLPHTVFEENHI